MENEQQSEFHEYRDYVFVEDLVFHGYHGDIPAEKQIGQKFEFSIKLFPPHTRLQNVAKSDLLADTLDYTLIASEIEKIMQSTSYNMIEKLGHEIAKRAFSVYGKQHLQAIQIQIRKPQVPIAHFVKCTGVNIFRTANDFA